MTVAVRASRSTSTVASEPALATGKNQMAIRGDIPEKTYLAGHAHLRKDCLGAVDGLASLEPIETVGNREIAVRLGWRLSAWIQLAVVQVKHARREEQNERADEQTEIQMQISQPAVQQLPLQGYGCLCAGSAAGAVVVPPLGTIVVTEAGSFVPRSPIQCLIEPSAKV